MDTDSAVRPAVEALTLRVDESLTITPGRGIARLDPKDLAQLGAEVGDVLAIAGRRPDGRARDTGAHRASRARRYRIDGSRAQREGRPERARQIARPSSPARRVGLRPVGGGRFAKRADGRALVRLLEALPVVVGDRVRVAPFGSRILDFEVAETDPPEGVGVSGASEVVFDGQATAQATGAGVAYRDVGGLHEEIRRLREIVELPLRCPRVFRHLGIAAPKGVLLHGPPGTGKTLLARAVAHETDVAFVSVTGPEIIQKFYGESEARLRGIFEQANKCAPCIVFIDGSTRSRGASICRARSRSASWRSCWR